MTNRADCIAILPKLVRVQHLGGTQEVRYKLQETQIHVYKTRDEKRNMTRIQDKTQGKTFQNARQEETRQGKTTTARQRKQGKA